MNSPRTSYFCLKLLIKIILLLDKIRGYHRIILMFNNIFYINFRNIVSYLVVQSMSDGFGYNNMIYHLKFIERKDLYFSGVVYNDWLYFFSRNEWLYFKYMLLLFQFIINKIFYFDMGINDLISCYSLQCFNKYDQHNGVD